MHTVNGRNPKQPPVVYGTLWKMGPILHINWLARFLNHQQYYYILLKKKSFQLGHLLFQNVQPKPTKTTHHNVAGFNYQDAGIFIDFYGQLKQFVSHPLAPFDFSTGSICT